MKWIFYSAVCTLVLFAGAKAMAQDKRIVRMAKIRIDSAQIELYKSAVKEQIDAAVKLEPGVIMLYAVHDKKDVTNVTVFEIYADNDAYQSHLQTAHFKKYKTTTAKMVKSLELIDVVPIEMAAKGMR
jgi:quinol monooxygenase YgiN